MAWTPEQQRAIDRRGDNLLVAAAAGAGKTAVLVERVIQRLIDVEHPLDVDRLLVVTFTEAAAAEMRERIAQRLGQALAADPTSRHLQRQLALLGRANISTLHAFCLALLRQYFYRLDLDPAFRILSEHEGLLIRQEALDQVLEAHYSSDPPALDFAALVDRYGGSRADDASLQNLILQVYEFTRCLPWPEDWLRRHQAAFDLPAAARLEDTAWCQRVRQAAGLELERAIELTDLALALCHRPAGPGGYLDALAADATQLAATRVRLATAGWDEVVGIMQGFAFPTLRLAKGELPDPLLQERVKGLRDEVKKIIRDRLAGDLYSRPAAAHLQDLRSLAPHMTALAGLVRSFGAAYGEAKRSQALVDFGDLERYAFQLLAHGDAGPGDLRPSEVARELRSHFDEVLVDEYQDINELQDAILALVSRDGDELGAANRFMVGDVKQSIYRFRQAEPGLFIAKYRTYASDAAAGAPGLGGSPSPGRRIDLRANFRSRRSVVDAVNFVFRQVLTAGVGEMAYDEAAELVCRAEYPGPPALGGETPPPAAEDVAVEPSGAEDVVVEVHVLERVVGGPVPGLPSGPDGSSEDAAAGATAAPATAMEEPEAATALQREAELIATRIADLVRGDASGSGPAWVWDKQAGAYRPLQYRDIVILLRSPRDRVNTLVEVLSRHDVPAYAEAATGYFARTEVETMLALLQLIDNPRQDIPLATVLRSPIVGLTADQLARVRLCDKTGDFYGAVVAAAAAGAAVQGPDAASGAVPNTAPNTVPDPLGLTDLPARLQTFLAKLSDWRTAARRGPLSRLVWRLYEETGYLDFVGGMPGGAQRHANLLALYDRAREFDQFTRQGLFRFLTFIGRLRDQDQDLGEAPVSGEAADVVRLFSIHKSKGLEFPVVFVADLGKPWNLSDLSGLLLVDRHLGFGPMVVDPELRIQYPSLAHQAVQQARQMSALAEEMRVLYVALTRARERLILVGSARNLTAQAEAWARSTGHSGWPLGEAQLAGARCYLDWLLPAIARHRDGQAICAAAGFIGRLQDADVAADASRWHVALWPDRAVAPEQGLPATAVSPASASVAPAVPAPAVPAPLAAATTPTTASLPWAAMAALEPLPTDLSTLPPLPDLRDRLRWAYPYAALSARFAKGTATELKRRFDPPDPAAAAPDVRPPGPPTRPRFLQAAPAGLSPAEVGTATHLVLQHLDLSGPLDAAGMRGQVAAMVARELLTPEQAAAVDLAAIAGFHASAIGRLLQATPHLVRRELSFSLSIAAQEVYPDLPPAAAAGERVLVQGVIDCLLEHADGSVLILDFKTDHVADAATAARIGRERYAGQVALYRRAVQIIQRRPVREAYLYFLKVGAAVAI